MDVVSRKPGVRSKMRNAKWATAGWISTLHRTVSGLDKNSHQHVRPSCRCWMATIRRARVVYSFVGHSINSHRPPTSISSSYLVRFISALVHATSPQSNYSSSCVCVCVAHAQADAVVRVVVFVGCWLALEAVWWWWSGFRRMWMLKLCVALNVGSQVATTRFGHVRSPKTFPVDPSKWTTSSGHPMYGVAWLLSSASSVWAHRPAPQTFLCLQWIYLQLVGCSNHSDNRAICCIIFAIVISSGSQSCRLIRRAQQNSNSHLMFGY